MKTVQIRLSTIVDVRDFVNAVVAYSGDVDLASGRYVVDGKSIMGIFSLDLSKPIELVAHSDDADKFLAEIKEFIVD